MNKYDNFYKEFQKDNFQRNNQICDDLISKVQQKYNLPAFDPRINGVNKLFMLLTSEYSECLIHYLQNYDYNYSAELQYLIANFCYSNPNSNFLRLPSVRGLCQEHDGYIVESKLGRFSFNLSSNMFQNIERFNRYGQCHYVCHNFILVRKDVKAVTSLIPLPFNGYQYHSYIEYDESRILDLSHNCFMDKEEYLKVFQPQVLNVVTANDIDEQQRYINEKESLSEDKELLLRLAIDKQL